MLLNWSEHEIGPSKPRIRVWTAEQARYGQFDVMDYDDFKTLEALFAKYKWSMVEATD